MKKLPLLLVLLAFVLVSTGNLYAQSGGLGGGIYTNAARRIAGKGVASLPATCALGDVFVPSGAPITIYLCTAVNTWTGLTASGGTFLAGDGTAAAPSHSFTSDPDTGMFRSAANLIGFSANGTEQWDISQTCLCPFTNGTEDIGNGSTNPRDLSLTRNLVLSGSSSGTTTVHAPAAAGTADVTLPNASSTLPIFGQQITFTGPTAARTYTLPDQAVTLAGLGVTSQTFASPLGIGGISGGSNFEVQVAGAVLQRLNNTNTTGGAELRIISGNATTSDRTDLVSFISNETSAQWWKIGMNATKNFVIRDDTGTADRLAISQTTGSILLGSSADAIFSRRAAATFQHGDTDAASPVAQTIAFQGSRGGTDTNTAGADATFQGSLGTGTATVKAVNVTAAAQGTASGTTQQTAVLRLGLNWVKSLSNNTVTTVANVTDAANTSAAVIIHYAVEIFDGTNVQYEVGMVSCGINNKAGAFTQNTCTKFGNTQGVTSGTLTVTWTITAANPALLQINSNSSLTPTTNRVTYSPQNLTQQSVSEQ